MSGVALDCGPLARDARRAELHRRRIPGCCFAEGNGKDSAVTMNDIETKQERNLQTRFFHCHMLKLISSLRSENVERGSQETLSNQIQMLGAKISVAFAIELL